MYKDLDNYVFLLILNWFDCLCQRTHHFKPFTYLNVFYFYQIFTIHLIFNLRTGICSMLVKMLLFQNPNLFPFIFVCFTLCTEVHQSKNLVIVNMLIYLISCYLTVNFFSSQTKNYDTFLILTFYDINHNYKFASVCKKH